MKSVCVFCGSSPGREEIYALAARELGKLLLERKLKLVYGGATVGLMGIIADTVLAGGGEVAGVIPAFFSKKEIAHQGLTELIYVESMTERKKVMADLSDGFLTLPGAYGTMDELFEALTWSQLSFHNKPVGLLNVNGFYDPLLILTDSMKESGFLRAQHREMLLIDTDAVSLLNRMEEYCPPFQDPWLKLIREQDI